MTQKKLTYSVAHGHLDRLIYSAGQRMSPIHYIVQNAAPLILILIELYPVESLYSACSTVEDIF
jgi:hypothetical protein